MLSGAQKNQKRFGSCDVVRPLNARDWRFPNPVQKRVAFRVTVVAGG